MSTKVLLAFVMVCPFVSWGQEIKPFDGKPGLWETTVTSEISGMPAMPAMPQIDPDMLKNMPPEQRARIEAMMAGRNMGSPRTTTQKVCMTKESFQKGFNIQDQKSCTQKLVSSSADKQTIHMECTQGPQKMSGDITVERIDSEHAKGAMVAKTSEDTGRAIEMKTNFSAKWLSSDCGNVKPVGQN